jgi:hypothetical protein
MEKSISKSSNLYVMKKLCLLLLSVVLVFPALAQQEKGYVYLKNGSILKGKYSFTENKQKVRLESAGNVWIFDVDEIDSMSVKRVALLSESDQSLFASKFFFRTELGVLTGNSENSQAAPFSLTGSVNYIQPKLSVGLGLGLEFFNETYMPVFANIEYKFKQSSSSPYLFLKAGYQVPLEESNAIYYDVYPVYYDYMPWPGHYSQEGYDTKGGFLINPGFGYQQMFTPGFGMNFAVGYQFHRLNYSGENDYSLDIDYNRMSIKIGIIFN